MQTLKLFLMLLLFGLVSPSTANDASTRKVFTINEHLIAFYDGRDPSGRRYRPEWNWVDDGAMKLGVATYAIYKGDQAVVLDTFTSVDQARWVRDHLRKLGVRRFTVVLSHWHMDHVGGNAVYRDSHIIAPDVGRATLVELKSRIEAGEVFGPPGIQPLIIPDIAFHGRLDLYLGDLKIELHNLNIHTSDGTVVLLPDDKLLLAGDTLEDSVTYIAEPGDLPTHLTNLARLKMLDFDRILPNHGDPDVIRSGGYDKKFVDATASYIRRILTGVKNPGYLEGSLETYIGDTVRAGIVHSYEPYRDVHKENLKAVYDYYKDKPAPRLD